MIFDDCLSKRAIKALQSLADFSKGNVEFAHLADRSLSGQIDDDWIPSIKGQGWIVMTTDRGKKPSPGGKLPHICQLHCVTHVMMSASVHKRNTFDKLRAVFEVWPDLLTAMSAPPGCGYLLQETGGPSRGRVKLAIRTQPPDATEPPKTQQTFA